MASESTPSLRLNLAWRALAPHSFWQVVSGAGRRLREKLRTGEDIDGDDIDKLDDIKASRRKLTGSVCPVTGGRICHPAHSTVELPSGVHVRLDTLTVGDVIRTPSGLEPVVGFLHTDALASSPYHVLTTEANQTIAISDKHWLFVDGVEADPATVKLGQMLSTVAGPQLITAITRETHVGAYHPITPSGAYYVDGIAASTYAAYIPHNAWKVVGDSYVTLRYHIGLPVVPEGAAPVSLFWLLDALTAVGVPDAVQSAALWPLIAGSVMLTELASAIGAAVASSGTLSAAIAAAPLAVMLSA